MKIVLNDQLEAIQPTDGQRSVRETRRKGGHLDFNCQFTNQMFEIAAPRDPKNRYSEPIAEVVSGVGDHERTQKGFANVVAEAYSSHLGLVLHPHDIWYVVLSNIAAIVGKRPENYRGLYTAVEGKQELLVPTNGTSEIDISALILALDERMPVNIELFLPDLSTATPMAKLAMFCAVLDAAKHYYDYGMFCCGIPFIDLRGTEDDWNTLIGNVIEIQGEVLSKCNPLLVVPLTTYLTKVYSILCNIEASFSEDQIEFWKDIFTKENVGSGGDLKITGWICDLYHNTKQGDLIRSFHDAVSQVPYVDKSTQEHFMMFAGAFGSNVVDGAIEIAYDRVIVKYTPKETK